MSNEKNTCCGKCSSASTAAAPVLHQIAEPQPARIGAGHFRRNDAGEWVQVPRSFAGRDGDVVLYHGDGWPTASQPAAGADISNAAGEALTMERVKQIAHHCGSVRTLPPEFLMGFAQEVIADFLKRTGQYVTNDASRQAAIAEATAPLRAEVERLRTTPAPFAIPQLNTQVRWILGRPSFTCIGLAESLRLMGHHIARRAEAEQAAVLHWMLTKYQQHGDDWRRHASTELDAVQQRQQAPAPGDQP